MKSGKSHDNQEDKKILLPQDKLTILLSFHKDFSKVLTISSLIEEISKINSVFKKNFLNINYLINNNYSTNNINNSNPPKSNDFLSFCKKAIVCFPVIDNYSYDFFMNQIKKTNSIEINSNLTILNLLADASTFLNNSSINNYIQFSGLKSFYILENNFSLLKIFSNRLINSRNFEKLRLMLGDWVLIYFFKYCSMFVFDEKCQNYIQVLGNNFKTLISKLISVPRIEKAGNNNFYFTKVFTSVANSNFYTPKEFQKKNFLISNENNNYVVERTKIYYCSNFNRKLGFFRNLKIIPIEHFQEVINGLENMWKNKINLNNFYIKINKNNNNKIKNKDKNNINSKDTITLADINNNFVFITYNKLFSKVNSLLPIQVRSKIYFFFNYIAKRINNFNYPKELFNACPMMKNWQNIKMSVKVKLKEIEKIKGDKKLLNKEKVEELMEQLKQLINTNIHYDNIYKFVKKFLKHILPVDMLGPKNNKVLLFKSIEFIKMNRFETFNKLNLFSHKEFSFNEMKWLQFTNFSKKKYCEIGILLKNFVMKTLIHWVFNFILVQLFRSHFFVTEKQGEHFKSLYYHKTIYDLIIKICYDKYIYITNQYQISHKNEAVKTLTTIDSAPGKLRLMPKATTMRPITSFKRKTYGQNKIFLKNKLFDIQKIFKYIQNKMQSNSNNCVVFDYKEIMKRLINFKLRIIKTSPNSKMFKHIFDINNFSNTNTSENKDKIKTYLNYVTMDIEACYDNININLLNKFLDTDDTISPTYVTGILYVLIPKANKVKSDIINSNYKIKIDIKDCFDIKLLYMVSDLKEYIHMLDYIDKSEDITYKNCIIYIDEGSGINFKSKAQFIPTVRNIINNNYIKFNRNYLKQTNGIPQGLSVSSFLCNLFFYEIEKELSCYIQRELNNNQSLLLRFMDDYLCLANTEKNAIEFKENSVDLSHKNKFNFNMKKMQSNIDFNSNNNKDNNKDNKDNSNENNKDNNKENKDINNKNNITNEEDKKEKEFAFTWNGMFFNVTNKNHFNLVYDLKLRGDEELSEYSKLINVNLPVLKDETDYSWFIKKINSVLFSGHPWIYFMNNINDKKILELNLKNLLKFIFFNIIVLIRKVESTSIQPSQNKLINILDTCIMKLYSFLDNKIYEIEQNHFFIPYNEFHKKFYCEFFRNYFINKDNNKLNNKIISYSPLLFKAVKRKIEKFRLGHRTDVIKNLYEETIKQLKNKKKKQ